MSKFNLLGKLLTLTLIPLIGTLVLITSISYNIEMDELEHGVAEFRSALIKERKQQLKEVTEVASGIVSYQKTLPNQGDIKGALRGITFGKAGYFYIYDTDGKNIFHGLKPEIEGKNLINLADSKGNKIIVGLLDAAKNGDGIFSYFYQKPGETAQIEKLGYAVIIPGTNWMLGTGAYLDDIEEVIENYALNATTSFHEKMLFMLLIAGGLIIITSIIIYISAAKMVKPIQGMADNLNDIAQGEGDLTQRLTIQGDDEIAQLGRSFNLFVERLQNTISDINSATVGITKAGSDMNQQSSAIATQLQHHNNETDQVVSAITEMSSTANEVANNTNQVAEATQAVTDDVLHAQECVEVSLSEVTALVDEIDGAASSMNSLSEQSQKINNVLTVIGSIAEQTNLLALNAAIEAARAGEQGRGFAVVADEVRSLASRTQTSTLEINEMLNELHRLVAQSVNAMSLSQERSVRSVDSSRAISESLTSVTTAITSINDMSTQIATATTEQSSVTEEVNRNICAIQKIVNSLTENSTEAEKIAANVLTEGDKLGELVGQFKT
ncbi:chemotaxis protein [Psychromonas marina]|uniref:Chemotaxis protein n=1 Tax=Psychromonas marina TaxID=88364 RepID=A0ABQ6DY84_9GAMM|nr:methyl-accepting chemotaxis protein [Psychromonas marina]GLS89701.1 chemotaxis protein [Psychromonas marina]